MKNKKVNIFVVVFLVGVFAVVVTIGSTTDVSANSENPEESEESSNKETKIKIKKVIVQVETQLEAEKKQEFKTYEVAVVTDDKESENAQVHQKKIAEVIKELETAGDAIEADQNGTTKNDGETPDNAKKVTVVVVEEDVKGEEAEHELEKVLEEVVKDEEEIVGETIEAIEEIESRSVMEKLVFGDDYENLDILRSDVSHNRNDIRKLTWTMEQTTDPVALAAIDEALTVMMQERTRIQDIISENEGNPSFFGRIRRFETGYIVEGIEDMDEAEESLAEDVAEAIEEAMDGVETGDDIEGDDDGTEAGIETNRGDSTEQVL